MSNEDHLNKYLYQMQYVIGHSALSFLIPLLHFVNAFWLEFKSIHMPPFFNKHYIHDTFALKIISTFKQIIPFGSSFMVHLHSSVDLKTEINYQDIQNKLVVSWQSLIFIYTSGCVLLASNFFLYSYLKIITKHLNAPMQHQGEHLHASWKTPLV